MGQRSYFYSVPEYSGWFQEVWSFPVGLVVFAVVFLFNPVLLESTIYPTTIERVGCSAQTHIREGV